MIMIIISHIKILETKTIIINLCLFNKLNRFNLIINRLNNRMKDQNHNHNLTK